MRTQYDGNTNVIRTQYDGNTIKESILKDSNIITPTWREDFEIYRKEAEEAKSLKIMPNFKKNFYDRF